MIVGARVSLTGKTPLVLVTEGVKTKAASYEELFLNEVVKNLSRDMLTGGPDGTPTNAANRSQSWLRNNVPDFVCEDEGPPTRPACGSEEDFRARMGNCPVEDLCAAVEAGPTRLEAPIGKPGRFFKLRVT